MEREIVYTVQFAILCDLNVFELADRPDVTKPSDEDLADRVKLLMMNALVETIDGLVDMIIEDGKDKLPPEKELKRQLKGRLSRLGF